MGVPEDARRAHWDAEMQECGAGGGRMDGRDGEPKEAVEAARAC